MQTAKRAVVVLLAASALLIAQPASPGEAVRQIAEGRYADARESLARLMREGAERNAGIEYRAGLAQLAAMAANYLGRFAEAQREAEQGLALLGPARSETAASARILISLLLCAAEAHAAQGRFVEARAALDRAQPVALARFSPDDPQQAAVHDGFGNLWLARGDLPKAEQSLRAALGLLEARLGPSHADYALVALNLASVLVLRRKPGEAVEYTARAAAILEKSRGPSHPLVLSARMQMGLARITIDPAEGERQLRAVLEAWLVGQPAHSVAVSNLLAGLAAARFRQRDPAGAAEFGARSLAVLRECLGPEHQQVVMLMLDQSRLLGAARRKKEASALRAQAERIRKEKGYEDSGRHAVDIRALLPE